jgi:hypothetical protein
MKSLAVHLQSPMVEQTKMSGPGMVPKFADHSALTGSSVPRM